MVLIGVAWRRFGEWWQNTEDRWFYVEGWALGTLIGGALLTTLVRMIH